MVEAVFIGTFVPLVLLLALLRHSRPMMGSFCWGIAAFLIVHLISPPLYTWLGVPDRLEITAVFVGPVLEELLKPLPILIIGCFAVRSLVPYFYILGISAGIGFAVEENLIYLLRFIGDEDASRTLMILRSFSTCLMHGVATGFTGWTLTLARRRPSAFAGIFPLVGITLAIVLHASFNWLMLKQHMVIGILLAFVAFIAFLIAMKELETNAPETRGTVWE